MFILRVIMLLSTALKFVCSLLFQVFVIPVCIVGLELIEHLMRNMDLNLLNIIE